VMSAVGSAWDRFGFLIEAFGTRERRERLDVFQ